MVTAISMLAMLCTGQLLQPAPATVGLPMYVKGSAGTSGQVVELVRDKSEVVSRALGSPINLHEHAVSSVLTPNRTVVAALYARQKKLVIAPLTGGKAPRVISLFDSGILGSRWPETLLWASPSRLLVYLHDYGRLEGDVIMEYSFDGEEYSSSAHKLDSPAAAEFASYRRLADAAHKIVDAHNVPLLGHHRAMPFDAQEFFGYAHGDIGTISKDGDLIVARDLSSLDVVVIKKGEKLKRITPKSGNVVMQLRIASDLILLRTDDGLCEIWDINSLQYLKSVKCNLILEFDAQSAK